MAGGLALIDGGLPVNLPLAIIDLFSEDQDPPRLYQSDGGLVATQSLRLDFASQLITAGPLIEGERYRVRRSGGCSSFGQAGSFTHDFTVLPAVSLLSQGVSVNVIDAGQGPVLVSSSGLCSEPATATFATFGFSVDPAAAPLLPFYGWKLSLRPVDGGPDLHWRSDESGALLADGSLRRDTQPRLELPRISTVFHVCGDAGGPPFKGAPVGTYRAVLSARLLASDAGFDSVSPEFELANCAPSGCGCDGSPGTMVVLLAALGLLRRRLAPSPRRGRGPG